MTHGASEANRGFRCHSINHVLFTSRAIGSREREGKPTIPNSINITWVDTHAQKEQQPHPLQ